MRNFFTALMLALAVIFAAAVISGCEPASDVDKIDHTYHDYDGQ